jgi:hypothetical protein
MRGASQHGAGERGTQAMVHKDVFNIVFNVPDPFAVPSHPQVCLPGPQPSGEGSQEGGQEGGQGSQEGRKKAARRAARQAAKAGLQQSCPRRVLYL